MSIVILMLPRHKRREKHLKGLEQICCFQYEDAEAKQKRNSNTLARNKEKAFLSDVPRIDHSSYKATHAFGLGTLTALQIWRNVQLQHPGTQLKHAVSRQIAKTARDTSRRGDQREYIAKRVGSDIGRPLILGQVQRGTASWNVLEVAFRAALTGLSVPHRHCRLFSVVLVTGVSSRQGVRVAGWPLEQGAVLPDQASRLHDICASRVAAPSVAIWRVSGSDSPLFAHNRNHPLPHAGGVGLSLFELRRRCSLSFSNSLLVTQMYAAKLLARRGARAGLDIATTWEGKAPAKIAREWLPRGAAPVGQLVDKACSRHPTVEKTTWGHAFVVPAMHRCLQGQGCFEPAQPVVTNDWQRPAAENSAGLVEHALVTR
ncbi:hypothetical protein OPT61_g9382 [Boeremia exigua]|uniref:Uncharacterized protein n=1 Tax=Boeremia exigua TaxID=749465 RepID=A0ACC2HV48_9PLEO|nr:hypothetical protein OPT61_g9382 [Boeremia exigua]